MAMSPWDSAVNDEASRRMAAILAHSAESVPEQQCLSSVGDPRFQNTKAVFVV